MRRFLAIICAALMLLSTFTAATAQSTKEPVTIAFWYRNGVGEQEYTKAVQDKLNEMLSGYAGYEHISLELHPCANLASDFALAQASGEVMDLVATYGLNLTTEVENGSFVALDDYLAANPEITADLPQWLVGMGIVDGKNYGIPNYQQAITERYWATPKEYLDNSGFTAEEIREILANRTPESLAAFYEKYLLAIRAYTGKETKWIPADAISGIGPNQWMMNGNGINLISWSDLLYWDEAAQQLGYLNFQEDVVAGIKLNGEFYEKGYVHPDIATLKDTDFYQKNYLNDESWVFNIYANVGPIDWVTEQCSNAYGCEMVLIPLHDHFFINNIWASGYLSVSSTCEHPEDAAAIIALLDNAKYKEFYNTLVYGLEGVHYEVLDENNVKTLEFDGKDSGSSCSYTCWRWIVGNTFNAIPNQGTSAIQNAYIIDELHNGANTMYSPLIGITFKTAELETQISQVKAVTGEYMQALQKGIMGADTEAYYDEYVQKVRAAGIEDILANLNVQISAYLSAK